MTTDYPEGLIVLWKFPDPHLWSMVLAPGESCVVTSQTHRFDRDWSMALTVERDSAWTRLGYRTASIRQQGLRTTLLRLLSFAEPREASLGPITNPPSPAPLHPAAGKGSSR